MNSTNSKVLHRVSLVFIVFQSSPNHTEFPTDVALLAHVLLPLRQRLFQHFQVTNLLEKTSEHWLQEQEKYGLCGKNMQNPRVLRKLKATKIRNHPKNFPIPINWETTQTSQNQAFSSQLPSPLFSHVGLARSRAATTSHGPSVQRVPCGQGGGCTPGALGNPWDSLGKQKKF